MENPQAYVETRTSPATSRARPETRGGWDENRGGADLALVATVPYARVGLSELDEVPSFGVPSASERGAGAIQSPRPARAPTDVSVAAERRRLARDLHDGVQNELVALIVKLALAQQDPRTPPALADELAGLEARAQAALDSVRAVARGIYPPRLTDLGVIEALRAQSARAAITVSIVGAASRSTREAEEAAYFACSEAIQNAAKHAGRGTKMQLSLQEHAGWLALRVADDGRGFDPARTARGVGLRNIRERIESLGGSFHVTSRPRRGTVLTISLPWPTRVRRG